MEDIDAEGARLGTALEDTLLRIMLDFDAPQATRDAADRILTQRLNERLRAALGDFEVGAMRLLDLVDQLGVAVAGLGRRVPQQGAVAELPALLGQAAELHRHFHDAEGMRTTHTTQQEAEAVNRDEEMLPPPPAKEMQPLTALSGTGQVLHSPVPRDGTRYEALADEYVRFFAGADYKSVEAERVVGQLAEKALKFSPRYKAVGDPLGIPWWFIAGVHMLESSFNFGTHLHNGDPLAARTFRVPAGRPKKWNPPTDWESSAKDALQRLVLDKQGDWSLPRALYRWEAYNGFGYRRRQVPSPYLWSLSTIYGSGKFVADGVFDRNAVSKQCGAATLLKHLHQKGHVALTLDWVGEAEDALSPAFEAAAEEAAGAGRTTVDPAPPADAAFEQFMATHAPGLVHFKPSEFLMLGGSGDQDNSMPPPELWPNVVDLAKVLDALREALGHPIVLNSVYRNETHNAAVGGVKGSQHRLFRAADLRVVGHGSPPEWAAVLKQMRAAKLFQGGIGVYRTFVHVDTRGWNADW
jgi:lysozyme family protein